MRTLSVALIFILLPAGLGWPFSARADGIVSMSWDHPAGPGQPPIPSRAFTGPGPVDLYVTVNGLSTPIKGLEVVLIVNPFNAGSHCLPNGPLPQAWRFEAGGCEAGRLCHVGGGMRELLPDPSAPLLNIADYSFDAVSQRGNVVLAELYPVAVHPDPARTYTLLRLRFDFSGECEGANTPLAIYMPGAKYLDESGNEIHWAITYPQALGWNTLAPFARTGASTSCVGEKDERSLLSDGSLGSLQSTIPVCDLPVPAGATSWGRLKSLYR